MRAASFICTLAALSCKTAGGSCDEYAEDSDLLGYCLSSRVVDQTTAPGALQFCAAASGHWLADCRTAWIAHQLPEGRYPTDTLRDLCLTDDCQFLVLDQRPSHDLLLQLENCSQAGIFAEDCRGHARQRWLLSSPSPQEIERIGRANTSWGPQLSDMIGIALGCGAVGDCRHTPNPEVCTHASQWLQAQPQLCGKATTVLPKTW